MQKRNNLLKKRRLQLNLTLKDVAKAVGVSEATVSRWETGCIANMKTDKIYALSKILELPPDALLIEGNNLNRIDIPLKSNRPKVIQLNRCASKLSDSQLDAIMQYAEFIVSQSKEMNKIDDDL